MVSESNRISLLIQNMKDIRLLITQVLEMEDHKYEIIKNMNIDQLTSYNESESVVLSYLDNLENKRKILMEDVALQFGFDSQLPVSKAINYFPSESSGEILDLVLEIKNICTRIDVITERNEYLLNSNMEIIGQILELAYGSSIGQYNSSGLTTEVKKQNLHMLDQLV